MKNKDDRHIDCVWLHIDEDKQIYICCDSRSSNHGFPLDRCKVKETACEFYHSREDKFPELQPEIRDLDEL